MTSHEPTHRKRELPQAELEATSNLKLGEFQNVPTLSLSEARLVITKVLDLRRKGDSKFEEREYVDASPLWSERERCETLSRGLGVFFFDVKMPC